MQKTITILTTAVLILSAGIMPAKADVTDRIWPQNYGEAHLCLWKDDALGAISYTIDDNSVPDHEWWIEMSTLYDFKCTWFVITNRVTDGPIGTNGYWGTWEGWRRLYNLGHDIQSHTVTHNVSEETIDYEYGESKRTLEEKIQGNKVLVIAYPSPGSNLTDPQRARQYYVGGRHVTGLINQADDIDYMSTHSFSSFNYEPDFWVVY